ncbi:MAG: PSD1 and planctomycete cytochrome C domain-containing protein [Planctomycetaceae bacterium]
MRLAVLMAVPAALAFVGGASAEQSLPEAIEFNRDVRPILSDNCFFCHGPDKNKREADLRLDTAEGLFGSGGDKGNSAHAAGVVTPKSLAGSLLYDRITSSAPEQRMPPVDSGKELSPREMAVLKKWIEQGAPFEGHWSFQPIKRIEPPAISQANFLRNGIDAFVLQTLREHGLEPSPDADKVTLVRRLYFDLLGLPPTPADVDKFVNDARPDAYEELVDRLLDSPAFGERMAVWWLDLVRYADTVGYHGDQNMSVFAFRDYVIRSFNENKPFDVFTREQLAGDLFPEPSTEHKIASGYNRLGMMSAEGGVQPKEYLAKYIAERVRNASGTWLGTTLGCAECHDHKFDPFTTKDFYSFEAFFADIEERGLYAGSDQNGAWGPRISLPTPAQAEETARLTAEVAAIKQNLETQTPELDAAQADWEKSVPQWTVLTPESAVSQHGVTWTRLEDGSWLATGESPATDVVTLTMTDPPAGITAFRLEVLPDDSLPKKGPGRAANGNFVLTEFAAEFQPAGETVRQAIALQHATASFEQTVSAEQNPYQKWSIAAAIDRDEKGPAWGWAILDQVGKPQQAVLEASQPISGGTGSSLVIKLLQNSDHPQHTLGRFRISVTSHAPPVRVDQQPPENITALLAIARDARAEAQKNELAAHFRSISPMLEPARQKLRALEEAKSALDKTIPTMLVTNAVAPRMVRVLKRGNWMDDTGEEVQPAVPSFLPQPPTKAGQRLTRADLAEWIVAKDNPLTARVFANRQWKLFFGAGLSRKLEDLGGQGEWPSHPLLLDWLATQFIDSGWNVKQFVKLLVMSGAYRQSSLDHDKLREIDPYNRLLARQSRFRIEAEFVRDNALAVSGLLVTHLGGPSVKPYQPPGYWAYLNFPMREWQNGSGEELYRRGLYTHWQRQYLHPSLLAFDAPSREECTADRPRSNTPLQSLALLNDPTYVEAARALAERVLKDGGSSTDERLNWLFRQVLSRTAKPAEVEVLKALLEKHQREYQGEVDAAKGFVAVGAKPVLTDVPPAELAAWTSVTRALLNLHETMTRN